MPELPEVETMARLIRPDVLGKRLGDASVTWARTLGGTATARFRTAVEGARVARVGRRAKWIVVDLERSGRPAGHLLVHLRMTGRLVVLGPDDPPEPFERVSFALDGGPRRLAFTDVRKFGRVRFVEDPDEVLAGLGPEPLGEEFTAGWLRSALRGRKRLLKPLLLDQTFLAGLGNIYVDEALHRAGLHPLRRADRVPGAAADRLHAAIREVLAAAIEHEGSSFDTFYRTPEGRPGSYQDQFRVYGRDGRPCRTCGATVAKIVVGQRGTHLCRRCQRAPRRSSALPTAGRE